MKLLRTMSQKIIATTQNILATSKVVTAVKRKMKNEKVSTK